MTHTYRHVFANGTKATATITLNPFRFEVEWDGPTSRKLFPEYCRWRQTIFEDVAQKSGKRIAIIDLASAAGGSFRPQTAPSRRARSCRLATDNNPEPRNHSP